NLCLDGRRRHGGERGSRGLRRALPGGVRRGRERGPFSGPRVKTMAGIGWKLQRLIDRGSLAGTIGAYLTGVAVTSAPWLLTAPVHVVVSRYTADRLYDHHLEKIGGPLRWATAATLAGFAICGVLIVVLMKLPLAMAVVGAPLCAIVGAQWLMLSVGGGMT